MVISYHRTGDGFCSGLLNVEGKKRKFTTYARGASLYSMNYYSFVNLAKEAGANIQIKKKVIVDLDILEKYIEEQCREEGTENV